VQLEVGAIIGAFKGTQAEEEIEIVGIEHGLELHMRETEALEWFVGWVAARVHLLVARSGSFIVAEADQGIKRAYAVVVTIADFIDALSNRVGQLIKWCLEHELEVYFFLTATLIRKDRGPDAGLLVGPLAALVRVASEALNQSAAHKNTAALEELGPQENFEAGVADERKEVKLIF
jgi:hypothetical protein